MESKCPSKSRAGLIAKCFYFTVAAVSCLRCGDEILPPVVQPRDVLSTTVALKLGVNGFVVLSDGVTPLGDDGAVDVKVSNLYNEVLSDSEQIRIETVIFQASHPERCDTVIGTRSNVQTYSFLIGKLVAIPPGQQFEVLTQWSHTYDGGTPFWTGADIDSTITVQGTPVLVHRVTYTISTWVKIFKTRQAVYVGNQNFTVYYRLM